MAIPFVDMELDDYEKSDIEKSYPVLKEDKPEYPYGLRICLTGSELDKLNLDPEDAFIGGIIHGHFLAKITSISANAGEEYSNCRIELQICSLAVESEDAENEENEYEE